MTMALADRFRREYNGVCHAVDRFAQQASQRVGNAITAGLQFLPGGEGTTRVHIVLSTESKHHTAARLVWWGGHLRLNHRTRLAAVQAHNRGRHAEQFLTLLQDALVLGLDDMIAPCARSLSHQSVLA